MSRLVRSALILTALVLAGVPSQVRADDDIGMFYDALAPYGSWVAIPTYGWVWDPDGVPVDWRPYTEGYWTYTDYGWTWVSSEPWGWAAFHYGRWVDSDAYGWVWIPGAHWGPAWVAWRYGPDSIGWAPLPPGITWSVGVGLNWGSFDFETGFGWNAWVFCEPRWLYNPKMTHHLFGLERNQALLRKTHNVTDYGFADGHVVDRGFDVRRVEKLTGHRIPHYALHDLNAPPQGRGRRITDHALQIYRPTIGRTTTTRKPPEGQPRHRADFTARQRELQENHKRQLSNLKAQQKRELKRAGPSESRESIIARQQREEARLRDQQARERSVQKSRNRRPERHEPARRKRR